MSRNTDWRQQLRDVAETIGLPAQLPDEPRIILVRTVHSTRTSPTSQRAQNAALLQEMCRNSRCPTCFSPATPTRIAGVNICLDCGEEF